MSEMEPNVATSTRTAGMFGSFVTDGLASTKVKLRVPGREANLQVTTLEATVAAVNEAIAYCRDSGIRCLLVDVTEATGFPSPTIAQRFEFITRWAETSSGKVLISMIARPEMVLKDKLGVLIASNRRLVSDIFMDEDEALNWLKEACRQHME